MRRQSFFIFLAFTFFLTSVSFAQTAVEFTRTLSLGARGDDVRALQEFLKKDPALYPEGFVTGYFGSLTEKAVQRFQAKNGIVNGGSAAVTGYGMVGPKTRTSLNQSVGAYTPVFLGPPEKKGTSSPTLLLRRNAAERLVQKFNIPLTPIPLTPTFSDVPVSDPNYREIESLYRENITAGCGSGKFCPNDQITRGQLAVLIVTAWSLPLSEAPAGQVFSDVPPGHFAYPHVQIMSRYGLTAGCGNGKFCVDDPATPDQITAFLTPIKVFSDVMRNHAFWKMIEFVGARGLMVGYVDGKFGPDDSINRDLAATVIAARFNLDVSNPPLTPTFSDIPRTHPYYPHIEALYKAGITAGCGDGLFCSSPLTRAQLAVWIAAGMRLDPNGAPSIPFFTDVPRGHWAFRFIQLMYQKGISAGCGENVFCPERQVTRGEFAAFLYGSILNAPSSSSTSGAGVGPIEQ